MDASELVFHRKLAIEIPAEAELYEKLKAFQWNASTEIDWSRPIRNFSEESTKASSVTSAARSSTACAPSSAVSRSRSSSSASRRRWRCARS